MVTTFCKIIADACKLREQSFDRALAADHLSCDYKGTKAKAEEHLEKELVNASAI